MYRSPARFLLASLFALWTAAASAEAPRPVGGPLTLLRPQGAIHPNEVLTVDEAPSVAAEPGGGFVVAWIQQADGWTTSLLTRSISASAEVGVGRELASVSDCRNYLWSQRLVRSGTELSLLFHAHGHHVGDTLEYQVLVDWNGNAGTPDQAAAVSAGFNSACFQVSSNGYSASRAAWQGVTSQYSLDFPVVSHFAAISTQGSLYSAGQQAAFPLPGKTDDYYSSPPLPCPSFDWYGTAWWTFEKLGAPLLRVAPMYQSRSHTLSGFRDHAHLRWLPDSAYPYDYLLAAERSTGGLRVFRIEGATETLRRIGDTAEGDRVLASDRLGRLIVARPHNGGLRVRFLDAELRPEGEPVLVPSTRVDASFDDEARRVVLAWASEVPVFRPNGGSVMPVVARVFEWRP